MIGLWAKRAAYCYWEYLTQTSGCIAVWYYRPFAVLYRDFWKHDWTHTQLADMFKNQSRTMRRFLPGITESQFIVLRHLFHVSFDHSFRRYFIFVQERDEAILTLVDKFLSSVNVVHSVNDEKKYFDKIQIFLKDVKTAVGEILDKIDHWEIKCDLKSGNLMPEVDKLQQVWLLSSCWSSLEVFVFVS